jgi:hypothetical protein
MVVQRNDYAMKEDEDNISREMHQASVDLNADYNLVKNRGRIAASETSTSRKQEQKRKQVREQLIENGDEQEELKDLKADQL